MEIDLEKPGLVRIKEAAKFLAVCRASIYLMMDRGELKYVKIGKSRRIPRSELERIMNEGLVKS